LAQKNKVLKIENLSVFYRRICALRDVGLEVEEGEIVALIGANGAGKSTVMKAVLGIQRSRSGSILFMGQDITRRSTDSIVASGVIYIPEGGGILPFMTILENLQLGALHFKGNINESLKQVFEQFTFLRERQHQRATTLSGGERQMLAIGRALMAAPGLLMIDEPSLGLAPMVVTEVFNIIVGLKKAGYSILLSEQNAKKALQCADRAYILQTGNIILQGTGEELLSNQDVQRAYISG
jgi:branched-chain amino acid transport system ATP-binding protein